MAQTSPIYATFHLPKNVSNGTSPRQGQHLCQIILKSMHECKIRTDTTYKDICGTGSDRELKAYINHLLKNILTVLIYVNGGSNIHIYKLI